MASLEVRRIVDDFAHPWAKDVNPALDVLMGVSGGRVRLIGYDGIRRAVRDPGAGSSLATGEYTLQVQSAASGGPHVAVLHSGTASGATAAPTAANSVLLVRDDYTAIGMGKGLRLYDTVGTDYASLVADADGGLTLAGSGASAGALTLVGGITVTGAAKKFLADFSNATLANRFVFQSITAAATGVGVIPGAGATSSGWVAFNATDMAATGFLNLQMLSTEARLTSSHVGASYLPMTFYTNGAEAMRLATDGSLAVGSQTAIATVGKIRFNNNQGIVGRNAGNTADVDLIGVDNSDVILVGSFGNANVAIGATGKTTSLLGTVTTTAIDPPTINGQVTSFSQAKAYLYYDVAGGGIVGGGGGLGYNYNIAGVTKNGTGDFTLTFDRDFAGAAYAVLVTVQDNGANLIWRVNGQAAGSCDIHFRTTAGVLTDPDGWSAVAFGDLV